MCKSLHTILALRDLPDRRHVVRLPAVLEPLLALSADSRQLVAESVHAVVGHGDAHDVVVLEERTSSAAQGHLASL